MGNRGGFNPFRDANGEFTTPEGSGKPGRSRARSGAAGKRAPSPGALGTVTAGARANPTKAKIDRIHAAGDHQPEDFWYRRKNTDIYGQEK